MTLTRQDRPAVRLSGIEALRGLAAVAVVLCHAARHVDKAVAAPGLILAFQAGHAGVDLFFVISGFIILYVHGPDIGRPARLGHYLRRRCGRVLPLYWVALGGTIAISLAAGHAAPAPLDTLWSALLLPSFADPLLGIAWTLQLEMLFYALFAVLVADRRTGTACFAVWLVSLVAAAAAGRPAWLPFSVCSAYGLEFFLGMAAALMLRRWKVPAPRLAAFAGAGGFLTAMALESAGVLDGFGLPGRLAYGLAAMLLVLGVAASNLAGALPVPPWLRRMGDASYSIYLFQFVFIGLVWQALLRAGLNHALSYGGLFTILAAAALAGGLLMAHLVESPLLQATQRKAGASSCKARCA